jgi:hypothetical protein
MPPGRHRYGVSVRAPRLHAPCRPALMTPHGHRLLSQQLESYHGAACPARRRGPAGPALRPVFRGASPEIFSRPRAAAVSRRRTQG